MATYINIPVLPQNMKIEKDSVVLESHSLKNLLTSDPDLSMRLLNENGLGVDIGKLTWDENGRVKIDDILVKDNVAARIKKGDLAALNVCGLCSVT